MKIFYSTTHRNHYPRYYFPEGGERELFYETPARAESVLAALRQTDWAEILPPPDFGLEPILSVHSTRYLDYLRAAYADWQPYSPIEGQAFIPGSFTVDRQAAPSVVDVTGDIKTVRYAEPLLPDPSVLYAAPQRVAATRQGDQVTVILSMVDMTLDDDRGYMLDVWVCQNGALLWWPVALSDKYQTSYTFIDQAGCSQPSGGKLTAVEKHGYTSWVTIPWPAP